MYQNNNLLSITSGIFLSVSNYLAIVPSLPPGKETIHVLAVGIIGGAGGYLGKFLIQQTVQLFKKLIK